MTTEVLINITPAESRVAVLENGTLQELIVEREQKRGIVGNLFVGTVSRVLPGMEAAFIDIGLEKGAFLHVSDVSAAKNDEGETRPINQVLTEGQRIFVQVVKDPMGTKGARLTTQITVPARYLVLMPDNAAIGLSTKIEDPEERSRLEQLSAELNENNKHGLIVRTAAEGCSRDELQLDIEYLHRQWKAIEERAKEAKSGDCIYSDLELPKRIVRDLVSTDIEKFSVDSKETFDKLIDFAERTTPEHIDKIQHYVGERPLFDLYGVEDEIARALQPKVDLKSGGYLIIDQTEAMTTVDVNTGGFVGSTSLEETIFKTNLEATLAIARQLRLRNLGGIIIIDFIDMVDEDHQQQILQSLEKALSKDHARTHVIGLSELGLVEMTRKRTRESLGHVLCESCSECGGRGFVKTAQTVCYELFREIMREARQYDASQLLVLASEEVIELLIDDESSSLAELESFIDIPIKYQVENQYSQENFDVVPM